MTVPMIPPAAVRRTGVPQLRPLAFDQWQANRLSLNALTGQVGMFTRASTATMTDSAGATVTVGHSMPRYEPRAWNGASVVGLRMTTEDLWYPIDWSLGTLTILLEVINLGTAQTAGQGLFYLGLDAGTGNRLVVRGTGTTFAADLIIGANTSTATFPSAVANGDAVQLVIDVDDNGTTQRVRMGGTDNFVDVGSSAWGTAIARGALPSGARLRLNRVGSAGAQGSAWFRRRAVYPGALTLTQALERL